MVTMEKTGITIVRQIIREQGMSKYRLAKLMGVSEEAVNDWLDGKYFDEFKRLPRLLQVREDWMKWRGLGIWNNT